MNSSNYSGLLSYIVSLAWHFKYLAERLLSLLNCKSSWCNSLYHISSPRVIDEYSSYNSKVRVFACEAINIGSNPIKNQGFL